MASTINADNGVVSGITGIRTTADNTGNLALQANGVTLLTVNTANTVAVASGGLSISGATSGAITLVANATAGTNTLTLPASTGSLLSNVSSISKSQLPAGVVLQVVQTTNTAAFTTTSNSYVTFMTVSITPSSASNKVLITFGTNGGTAGDVTHGYLAIFRDATQLFKGDAASVRRGATSVINTLTQQQLYYGGTFLDSPATTSAISYTIQVLNSNGQTTFLNRSGRDTDLLAYDGRSVSSITVMEIAG